MSRFLISCGGTGGHLAPGIALAEGLHARGHTATLLISQKKIDGRLSEKYPQLRFARMPGTGFAWQPVQLARCVVSQVRAFFFCRALIRAESPAGIVGFGGFTSAPVVLAGRLAGRPVVLHESNRVPGRAIRTLGRFATRVFLPPGIRLESVSAAATRSAGLPVRREIVRVPADVARAALGFDPTQQLLVVFGGSQGASALNGWVREHLGELAAAGVQVCCVTGPGKGEAETLALQSKTGASVRVQFLPFSDRVAELLSAADLVVSRAGAGTLAELVRCAAPAILIPFPSAADDHQRANAAYFAQQGGGLVVEQTQLARLRAEVFVLLGDDARRQALREALQRLGRENSLELLVNELEQLTGAATISPLETGAV
jgi:UDP-N-acetylglucosamine--N-acetylmuramyl-(pentapeptide) pyrophosphoryl-undecaprenol N-acetylglucosamine transferase